MKENNNKQLNGMSVPLGFELDKIDSKNLIVIDLADSKPLPLDMQLLIPGMLGKGNKDK